MGEGGSVIRGRAAGITEDFLLSNIDQQLPSILKNLTLWKENGEEALLKNICNEIFCTLFPRVFA